MSSENMWDIIDGPSKFDLMTALFVWAPKHPSVEIRVNRRSGMRFVVNHSLHVTSVSAEDGSGESWVITGSVDDNRRVKIYFRTSDRKGWLQFIS